MYALQGRSEGRSQISRARARTIVDAFIGKNADMISEPKDGWKQLPNRVPANLCAAYRLVHLKRYSMGLCDLKIPGINQNKCTNDPPNCATSVSNFNQVSVCAFKYAFIALLMFSSLRDSLFRH